MAEEPIVATEETTPSTESATETSAVPETVSEDAQTPQKSDGEKYQQSLKALREERARRKQASSEVEELRARLSKLEAQDEVDGDVEEEKPAKKRVSRSEALAELAFKVAKDPSFRDRLDLVEERMQQGMTLEQADNAVLADIARKLMSSAESDAPSKVPKSIPTEAIPEAPSKRPTGDIIKDVLEGRANIPKEQAAAIRQVLDGLRR